MKEAAIISTLPRMILLVYISLNIEGMGFLIHTCYNWTACLIA